MVNDLQALLRETAAEAPHDPMDLGAVVAGGRRRVRRRRATALGGTALATAAIVGAGALLLPSDAPPDFAAAGVPRPDAPTLHLSEARTAVEGTDYRVLASHTNDNLDRDNGQYYEGVTEDGRLLLRDGPRADQPRPRFALVDPATGEQDWLPDPGLGQSEGTPLHLGRFRIFLGSLEGGGDRQAAVVHSFGRDDRTWTRMSWPDLPRVEDLGGAAVGRDGRLYVPVPAAPGEVPEGGWPTGPDGEADDADAPGDSYRLWSASLTDPTDVRDEGLTVGEFAFTDEALVWTDRRNGDSGQVHVRDLETGEESSFDPRSGERCNLLDFGAVGDHVMLSQYCGTYGDVRDDRVQIVDTDGDQVVTLQGSGIEGQLTSTNGDGLVTVTSWEPGAEGTFVYDFGSQELLRISDDVSSWGTGGPTNGRQLLWNTPVNDGKGMAEHLGELVVD